VTEAYEQGTDPAGIHRTGEEHRVVLRARNLPDASVSVAERETTAADDFRNCQTIDAHEAARVSKVVRRERLTSHLGDARLRARNEERAAGAGDDGRRARVAWKGAVCPSLLLLTDAGAARPPIASRRACQGRSKVDPFAPVEN
jgi:hypothetical protein